MKFGLTEAEFAFLKRALIDPLKSKGAQVYIFGSRARGVNRPFSDVDVLFEDVEKMIEDDFLYQLKSEIEDSHFPYKIDLVNKENVAASYWPNIDAQKIEV